MARQVEGKKGLADFIIQQSENIDAWELHRDFILHKPSRIGVCGVCGCRTILHVDVVDMPKGSYYSECPLLKVGFNIMQKWKIHRKLKKLLRRMEKRSREHSAQRALEQMVTSVLTGEK